MSWRSRGAAVLREPLAHFLVAGAAIFALFGNASSPAERRIVIDAPRVSRLAGQFEQSFRRLPSSDELQAIIAEDVKDEVYYREGVRLGLDRDDEVVRRRMRNKLESAETTADDLAAPDDATLAAWLAQHPERFAGEAHYTFDQRYLGSNASDPATALRALRRGEAFAGAPIPLAAHFEDAGARDIADLLGDSFLAALDRLPLGEWAGPVGSGVGQHLVRVTVRTPARPTRLADVRQRVENDWRAAMARRKADATYRAMLSRYDVVIEQPR